MEKKIRYCASCGDKTNELHCFVCGRATKPASMRYKEKELNLVADDLGTDHSSSDFHGDSGQKESKAYHKHDKIIPRVQRVHIASYDSPYENEQKENLPKIAKGMYGKAFIAIGVVFIILLMLFAIPAFLFVNRDTTKADITFDNLMTNEPIDNVKLTCDIAQQDGNQIVRIENTSDKYVEGSVLISNEPIKDFAILPYTTNVFQYEDGTSKPTCNTEIRAVSSLHISKNDVNYTAVDNDSGIVIIRMLKAPKDWEPFLKEIAFSYAIKDFMETDTFEFYVGVHMIANAKVTIDDGSLVIDVVFSDTPDHIEVYTYDLATETSNN